MDQHTPPLADFEPGLAKAYDAQIRMPGFGAMEDDVYSYLPTGVLSGLGGSVDLSERSFQVSRFKRTLLIRFYVFEL